MLIKIRRGWEMRESEATPEALVMDRRRLVQGDGARRDCRRHRRVCRLGARPRPPPDPSAGLYPVKRNEKYTLDRPITDEKLPTSYNNFYEFTEDKDVDADALPLRPWTVKIDGMVREGDDARHRRHPEADAARGAALSPPLRRGLVVRLPVERLSAEGAGRSRTAARQREVRAHGDVPRTRRSRPARRRSGIPGPISRG